MSQITSYTKDTKNNIEGSTPGSDGLMAFATDTGSLYISNDGEWRETPLYGVQNKPFTIPGTATIISQTPVMHFDASINASILDSTGNVATDGEAVSEWKPQIGSTGLYQEFGALQPTYEASTGPNGKPGITTNGAHGLVSNVKEEQVYDEGLTIVVVATYPGLSANETQDQFFTGAANNFGPLTYHDGVSNLIGTAAVHGVAGIYPHFRHTQNTTVNHYIYNEDSGDSSHTDTISNAVITSGSGDAAARGLTKTQYYNQKLVGQTHIYSIRQSKCNSHNVARATSSETIGSMHTYKIDKSDVVNGGSACWKDYGTIYANKHPLRGLALGRNALNRSFRSYYNYHEVFVFARVLSDADLRKLGEHLATKWQTGVGVNEAQFEL